MGIFTILRIDPRNASIEQSLLFAHRRRPICGRHIHLIERRKLISPKVEESSTVRPGYAGPFISVSDETRTNCSGTMYRCRLRTSQDGYERTSRNSTWRLRPTSTIVPGMRNRLFATTSRIRDMHREFISPTSVRRPLKRPSLGSALSNSRNQRARPCRNLMIDMRIAQ